MEDICVKVPIFAHDLRSSGGTTITINYKNLQMSIKPVLIGYPES